MPRVSSKSLSVVIVPAQAARSLLPRRAQLLRDALREAGWHVDRGNVDRTFRRDPRCLKRHCHARHETP